MEASFIKWEGEGGDWVFEIFEKKGGGSGFPSNKIGGAV